MPNKNHMTVIGHLARDPESKYSPNGVCMTNVTVAASDKWKDKKTGEFKESVEWVRAVIFGDTAELVNEGFSKGDAIHLEGKQVTRKWTDKQGNDRYSTELNANYVARPVYAKKAKAENMQSGVGLDDAEDEIPF